MHGAAPVVLQSVVIVGAANRPRWPWWLGLAALAMTFVAVGAVALGLSGLAEVAGAERDAAEDEVTLGASFVQDVALVAFALLFATFFRAPRRWHFGLRRAEPATLRWLLITVLAFYVFAALYSGILRPDGEQTVAQDLGAGDGTVQLVLAALLVVGLAPVAEEFFFRGLLFGAFRQRLAFLPAAAVAAVIFGLVHYSGAGTLELLPLLTALGFCFCLVYERTGSLYPAIAFHALNNAIAFPVAVGGSTAPWLGAGIGLAVITATLALARRGPEAPSPFGGIAT